MKHHHLLSTGLKILAFSLIPSAVWATQPLTEFLNAAKTHSFDAREQIATSDQRRWERGAALGRLLPSFTARGVYQHNQYDVQILFPGATEPVVITPQNQLDAFLQLDVPLIDIASYHRYRQAHHMAEAADLQKELAGSEVDRAVARSYYSFLGASALVQAAEKSVANAQRNLDYVDTRRQVGVALELDYERARANLERTNQDLADAGLMRDLAARALQTLTGIAPQSVDVYPEDDLQGEGNLSTWLASRDTPTDKVQRKYVEAAASARRAAATALLPTLSANAQERFTNAAGFVGRNNYYTLQAVLSWRLDYSTYATAEAQAAAADVQSVRSERARRGLEDSIYDAFRRVETGVAKSTAARLQAAAAAKAARLSMDRYESGAVTQLDVTQSQRDAFQAEAALIQADVDLAYARALLRTAAGKPVDETHVKQRRPITDPLPIAERTEPAAPSTPASGSAP